MIPVILIFFGATRRILGGEGALCHGESVHLSWFGFLSLVPKSVCVVSAQSTARGAC